MAKVRYGNESVALNDGECVLDALLRRGHDLPYGCRAGTCHTCIAQCDAGVPSNDSQLGLSQAQKDQGYFLPCSCIPTNDLVVKKADNSSQKIPATVTQIDRLNASVVRIRCQKIMNYNPGQAITLWKTEKIGRTYSLASVPELDSYMELHIKYVTGGELSPWAYNQLNVGDELLLQGPFGQCVYTQGMPQQPLMLIGAGTGLAPLYGLARDALHKNHQGPITLYLGAKSSDDFYLENELSVLQQKYSNFTVHKIAQKTDGKHGYIEGDVYQTHAQSFPELSGFKVYLCGSESFVRKMQQQCFLAGAKHTDILIDAFLPSGQR